VKTTKLVLVTNKKKTRNGAQTRLASMLYAVIMLIMPINPTCGGKAKTGKQANKIIPDTV